MTSWRRLYVTVEGHTEKAFADATLIPHFADFCIELKPRIVVTNRKLGARGGGQYYETIAGDIDRLMKGDQSSEVRFTTMVDLYALPLHFPGADVEQQKQKLAPSQKVEFLEGAWAAKVNSSRFLPFIQLHEFETLLYCDLAELERRIDGSTSGVKALRAEVGTTPPEDINDGKTTAPSKRMIRHVPTYERSKIRVGAPAASAIGLPALRAKCPHFNAWIVKLETLGSRPSALTTATPQAT